jgi:hypothetical protein
MASSFRSSVGVEFDERAWPRVRVAVPASIVVAGQHLTARLLNIARGGAMLQTAADLDIDTRITLHCGTIATQAAVIWKQPGKVGVSFVAPLCDSEVAEQIARAEAMAARRARAVA